MLEFDTIESIFLGLNVPSFAMASSEIQNTVRRLKLLEDTDIRK